MNLGLAGKNVLITGGTHGIGFATAIALANEGCNIAVCSRTNQRINHTLKNLQLFNINSVGKKVDVLIAKDIEKFCKYIISKWGNIDILINNVGGGGRWGSEIIEDTSEEVWNDVYNKNAMAAIRFTRFFIPYMKKKNWGRVITVSSIFGREGGGRPWFNMAKASEISLMKTLSMDNRLVRNGITFNSVAPGGIMIPGTGWEDERKKSPKKFNKMIDSEYPLGRMGTPEEVANLITFLCSNKSSLINGACIPIDGGQGSAF